MNCKIIISPEFRKDAKKLAKKYRSLPRDLEILLREIEENPYAGDRVGDSSYKIRLAIKSKGRGKSGGARVITYVNIRVEDVEEDDSVKVTMITIYDKSEIANLPKSVIDQIIKRSVEEE
jgi:mRNA-degrading endonuclease RelE of RelBE toxin-antitoxin system